MLAKPVDRGLIMKPELTVVAPCFNEEAGIAKFLEVLKLELEKLRVSYEVILVDDGSQDNSVGIASSANWDQLRILKFPVNLGHQAALDAGYRASKGSFVITMDSDLQHPPQIIGELMRAAATPGVDVVYATRDKRREDGVLKRFTAKRYYALMRGLTGIPIMDSAADFRIVSRRVVETLNTLPSGGKVFRLLIPSLGFRGINIEYVAAERFAGMTKYSLTKMLGLLTTSVVSFSSRPLWISIQIGFAFGVLALVNLGYTLFVFLSGETVPGWASTSAAILILFSINFLVLGVLGLYVGELIRTLKRDTLAEHVINRTLEE